MYYMVSDHLGSRKREPESIVVLKARDTGNTKEILLACLCERQGENFVAKLRNAFIKTISNLKSHSTKNAVRAMRNMLEQQISEQSVQTSLPRICGIICVDHTFLRFQNHGIIYFLNTKWGKNCIGWKCVPEQVFEPVKIEMGTFQEEVGILLAITGKEEYNLRITEEENQWIKSLQADCVKNPLQMDKRLKETMEDPNRRIQSVGPVIWIVPKEGDIGRDDATAGIF